MINLTQWPASAQQISEGVIEPSSEDKAEIKGLLNFPSMPTRDEIDDRASRIAEIAERYGEDSAMIGGAPFLITPLENALSERGVVPMHAYTERIFNSVVETACKAVGVQPVYAYTAPPVSKVVNNPDGSVTTTKVFEFKGFIEAVPNDPIDVDKDDIDKNEDNNVDNENSENMFDVDESEQITEDGVDDENIDGDDYDDFDDDDYDDFDDDDYDDFDDDDYDDFDSGDEE